ncbi:MAG: hypothetical protein H6Q89_1460 [Myxococcaceae bacterium]|nr:hypothetical protein [Myxococcaceae bacterium]
MTNAFRLLAGVLLLAGCKVPQLELPKITVPALPMIDPLKLPLPKTVDGKYLLMELSQARLEVDPTVRDPLTAVGECVDQVTYCYTPNVRSLDECVRSVRTCATQAPWAEPLGCCPKACQDGYAALRAAGTEPDLAVSTAFFGKPYCFPGVAAALEGT